MHDLLKLALVFVVIVVLLGRRWNLGYVLLLGSALLGLLYRLPALEILEQAKIAVLDLNTLRLVAAVLLITTLGELLRETGGLQQMVASLQELISDPRLVLAIVPALIGLLPMPGGAVLSAPMVQELGSQQGLSAEHKTFLNYWFRHVWEYIFPLYPALIVMSGMLGIPLSRLALAQAPLTAGAIAGGALLGLRGIGQSPNSTSAGGPRRWQSLRTLALSIWPIVLVIVLSLALELELALSLTIAIVLTAIVHRMKPRLLGQVLRRSLSPRAALLVVSIMIFKQVVLASGAADELSAAFISLGIAPLVITVAVPLLLGLLTGLTMSMVGIGYPLLLPLISGSEVYLNYAVLAFGAGFIGILLSPLHLCLALTRDYFQADWVPLYRRLLPAAAFVGLATAVAWLMA